MTINGEMFIGARAVRGTQGEIRAVQAETGEPMEPAFGGATLEDLDAACASPTRHSTPIARPRPRIAPSSSRPSPTTSWRSATI